MYRRIKKILIVPLLIVTLMSCIIYTDYRKPVQVEAAVLTGDPFVDIFSWALELVGFSPKNKENQAHALHEFSEWLVQQWKDNAAMLDTWMDADLKKKCDKWKAKLEKNWDSMSASEKYLEVRNIYTRKEYDQSGSSLSYSEWLDENYINTNPFKTGRSDSFHCPLNLFIERCIANGVYTSHYSLEQWDQAGTFSCLVMLCFDWMTHISNSLYNTASALWDNTIGNVIRYRELSNMSWFKFVNSDDFDNMVSYYTSNTYYDYFSNAKEIFLESKNTIISSIPCDYIEKISDIGTKYALAIKIFKSSGADAVEYWLVDVPDDCTTVKLNKYSYQFSYFSYKFLNSSGAALTSSNTAGRLMTYYASGASDFSFRFNNEFITFQPASFSEVNSFVNTVSMNSSPAYTTIIPFGMSDVAMDFSGEAYAGTKVYVRDKDDEDSIPFDITRVGNDISDSAAGTVIDIGDVTYVPAHDEVIDRDLTETGVAAREEENDKALTESITKAEEREKDEAKEDSKPDVGTDTKDEDLDKYKIKVTDIFPFCIPFDIYRFFSCLAADPVAPKFTIPVITENSFGIPEYSIEIDFAMFDTVAAILRKMELLGFCVGLAFATNKLIKH